MNRVGAPYESLAIPKSDRPMLDRSADFFGIFIHLKPKVEFAVSKEQIELGEFLLVRHHSKIGLSSLKGVLFCFRRKVAKGQSRGH